MSELTIREMENGEEFADWFADLTLREEEASDSVVHLEDHYLILSNEIGDWIGGLRYTLRGGVAHIQDIAVRPEERRQGHGHRLLDGFELRVREAGAHLAEFWTDDDRAEGLLGALGWTLVVRRTRYMNEGSWTLLEKRLPE